MFGKDEYGYPLENCDVVITLKDNQIFRGKYDPEHPQEHTDLWNKLCAEAEQFLNCSEKPNN